jgi:hypothetical protein
MFTNGRYHVTIHDDGSINVRHGDWLSKYSAAIYNDFWHIAEFGRLGKDGLQPIADVNKIFAGETLYHIPTYNARKHPGVVLQPQPKPQIQPVLPKPMTDDEKRRITVQTLGQEFHLQGDRLKLLDKLSEWVGNADSALTVAEIAGLIAEGTLAATASTAVGVANVILTPVGLTIAVLNAKETGFKLLGIASVAYTITAWAFDDPIPSRIPDRILQNNRSSGESQKDLDSDAQAWKDASDAAVKAMDAKVAHERKRKIPKKIFQIALQGSADGDRNTLAKNLAAGLEKERNVNPSDFKIIDFLISQYPN